MPSTSSSAAASRVVRFIEQFCRQSKGEWAGLPLTLHAWQRKEVAAIFAPRGPAGRRRIRTAYLGIPRKNGKSTLAAALALYGLVADDEPGAEVYSVAGDVKQAGIVFRETRSMVLQSPALSERIAVFQHHLEVPATGAVYRVLSADAALQQGLNPSFVVFDEVHVQPNEDLWTAVTQGMGTRRQPLLIGITTAGWDKGTLAGRLYEKGQRIVAGEEEDPTFHFRWWEPKDPSADWRSRRVWREANPAYGVFLRPDSFDEASRLIPENDFRRFRLNQWTATRSAFLPYGAWDACRDTKRVVGVGEDVVLMYDAAWTGDSAALVGCTINAPHLFVLGAWERPPHADETWAVDAEEVDAAVRAAAGRYRVLELDVDPHEWRREMARWRDDGLPVVEYATSSLARIVPATSEFYRAVVDGRVTHDGDPRLARHLNNAEVRSDRHGPRIVKTDETHKIDLAVAAIAAHDRAVHRPAAYRSVYETRGIRRLGSRREETPNAPVPTPG